ncbi:MAG: metal dependent phosphohydrolase [Proteobacteria bacterium]|nr:metal dependent phosphohydrolase [Pseudomonadota bacterium]
MLKKIGVEHLKLGMHLHEFCGSWMEHPFWRTKFVINSEKDLELIRASSIREVWIDIEKGDDVEAGVAKEESEVEIDRRLDQAVSQTPGPVERVSLAEEAQRAAKICAKSKEAVLSMFQEARMGKAVEAEQAMPLVEEINKSVERNPGALISLARLKTSDNYTYLHSIAVCALMIALGKQMKLDESVLRDVGMAGLFHAATGGQERQRHRSRRLPAPSRKGRRQRLPGTQQR